MNERLEHYTVVRGKFVEVVTHAELLQREEGDYR